MQLPSLQPDSRHAPPEPARHLRRNRRQAGRRNEIQPEHFAGWVDWAKANGHGMDFNPTCFSHPKADDGFTLASTMTGIRQFWIEHGIACRKIGAAIGQQLGTPCVTNVWIPDGYKDTPVDRKAPRALAQRVAGCHLCRTDRPAIQPGRRRMQAVRHRAPRATSSARTSSTWAMRSPNDKLLCLDAGHFHPTEVISDKISSVLTLRATRCCCTSAAACAGTATTS